MLYEYDKRGRPHRFIHGHNYSQKGKHHSSETREKIKKARAKQIITEETKKLWSRQRKGSGNPAWKGGRYKMVKGYICVWSPNHPNKNRDGYVMEHRLVMEKSIGRYLTNREVVHHKNCNKSDNRIENLRLFSSNGEHMKIEYDERKWHETS